MTDIPGTGKLTSDIEKEKQDMPPEILSTVNVQQLKKKDWQKEAPEDKIWYNTLWAWIAFGILGGLVFILLSFFNKNFLILSPVGPVASTVAWFIKRVVRRIQDPKSKIFR